MLTMNINLFKLALDRLQPSDWESFEELASSFLISEFNQLRTMASPSGDGGRDSVLFQSEGTLFIAFQYSIQKDWKSKIRKTVTRLTTGFPDIRILIYMTNQTIGGPADELKTEVLRKGLSLDTRDRHWFLERATMRDEREKAANKLIDRIARPYLTDEKIISKPSSPLSSAEAQAALLYLGLQLRDDATGKGLTKLSFDALVRAALRHTNSECRMSRVDIHKAIQRSLPSSKEETLVPYIDSALLRLAKHYIRYWQKEDQFCLTFKEHQRIIAHLAENEIEESVFHDEIRQNCEVCLSEIHGSTSNDLDDLVQRIPRVLEMLLLNKGEAFVAAIRSNDLVNLGFEKLMDIIINDLSLYPPAGNITEYIPNIGITAVQRMLAKPSNTTQRYLRRLSDSYTLFSFLNETPDVQSATRKLFSHGNIWLDTTVLLPIFAEQLEENNHGKFTHLFQICHEQGMELNVTPGVIEEINAHMNFALSCSNYRSFEWRGRTPYLYYQYLQTGRSASEFKKWLTHFRGDERPDDDVAQYLHELFGIKRRGLFEESQKVDVNLRYAAERLWTNEHQERRGRNQQADDIATRHLINHDIETYLGVIALRQDEQVNDLGYRHWLLTLDRIAWKIRDRLREEFDTKIPPSPLMSLDFLINNLAFGPERYKLKRSQEQVLPIVLDIEMSESMPQDILQIADDVRKDNEGLPEYVIRRKVRDAIDNARRRRGCLNNP